MAPIPAPNAADSKRPPRPAIRPKRHARPNHTRKKSPHAQRAANQRKRLARAHGAKPRSNAPAGNAPRDNRDDKARAQQRPKATPKRHRDNAETMSERYRFDIAATVRALSENRVRQAFARRLIAVCGAVCGAALRAAIDSGVRRCVRSATIVTAV